MTPSAPPATDFQRLVVEHALALAREVEAAAGAAPHGRVLDRCEGLLLTRGRDFLLATLQAMAQHTADEAVKKGGPERARAATASATRATRPAPSSVPSAPSTSAGSTSPASAAASGDTPPTPPSGSTGTSPPRRPGSCAWPAASGPSPTPNCS